MAVMQAMFGAEITAACGPKGQHDPDRAGFIARHCSARRAAGNAYFRNDGSTVEASRNDSHCGGAR